MNKNLLLALGLGVAFASSAQVGLHNNLTLAKIPAKNLRTTTDIPMLKGGVLTPKAGVDTVKYFNLSDQTGWVKDNSGQTGTDFGWAFTSTRRSWSSAIPTTFNSVSKGQYLEVKNGNPTLNPGTQALGVTYTVTSPSIDLATLGVVDNNISLRYYQVGARFNDLQQVLISIDNGATWVAVDDNSDKPLLSLGGGSAYVNPTIETVNLSSYIPVAGVSSILVRFSWTTNFPDEATNPNAWVTYGWGVDDILIFKNPQFDLKNTGSDVSSDYTNPASIIGPRYTKIPSGQQQDVTIANQLVNNGFGTLTNVKSHVDITTPSGTTTDTQNGVASLAAGATDTVLHTITLSAEGTYSATNLVAYATETDADSSNNNANLTYSMTYGGNLYASDNGTSDGVEPGDSAEFRIGSLFEIKNDIDLTGIDVYVDGSTQGVVSTAGTEIFGSIRDFDTQDFTQIDLTNTHVLASGDNNKWVTLVFSSPVHLTAGQNILATVETFGTGDPNSYSVVVGTSGPANLRTAYVYGDYGNGVNWYYTNNQPMVRMNFDPSLATKSLDNSLSANVYPNPANDKVTVEYNTVSNGDVTVAVVDMSGRTVMSNVYANQNVGNNKVELNVNNFNTGVYQVVISSNSSIVTKKLVIK